MIYPNVEIAVIRALSEEVAARATSQAWQRRIERVGLGPRGPGLQVAEEHLPAFDALVLRLLNQRLTQHQMDALILKYSDSNGRRIEAIDRVVGQIKTKAHKRFTRFAVVTWVFPKTKGAEGKRSTAVLTAPWYDMDVWDDGHGTPKTTRQRWNAQIRKWLELEAKDALNYAGNLLHEEGFLTNSAA